MTLFVRAGLCAVSVALLAAPAAAQPDGCTRDTLMVDGSPVDVTLCAPDVAGRKNAPAGEARPAGVTITESFAANGSSFSQSAAVDFLGRRARGRTIDDVPLAKLGIAKTLHLTIVYREGAAHLEHAMLIPGAVTLK